MLRRMTRSDWLASVMKPGKKQPRRAKTVRLPAQMKLWEYAAPLPGVAGKVLALTRSEARAEIKRRHQLKGRVPVGTLIVCLSESRRAA